MLSAKTFNFKLMRERHIPQRLIEFFEQHREIPSPDQDALNSVLAGSIKLLPHKWNRLQIYLDDEALMERPAIHYVSGVPWSLRLGAVANGRFRLWHAFADKYVYQETGESYRRCFPRGTLLCKRIIAHILALPILGIATAKILETMQMITDARNWREIEVRYDVSSKVINKIIGKGEG